MELLSKIIHGATESTEPLPNLLRRCLVLAHELKNDKLAIWVQKELNGYDRDDDALPSYRIVRIVAKGFFVEPYGSQINDQPLPPGVLDPEERDWAQLAHLTQPIASYESVRRGDRPRHPWPPGLTTKYQTKFFDHYVLNRAWQEIPSSAFVGLTDTVRNRILSFALELKGQLGDVSDEPERLSPQKVDKSVVYHIYGSNNVIASTAQTINQAGRDIVAAGDAESLVKALLQFGVEKTDAEEISGYEQGRKDGRRGTSAPFAVGNAPAGSCLARDAEAEVTPATRRARLHVPLANNR
jgi:hypothetical protein